MAASHLPRRAPLKSATGFSCANYFIRVFHQRTGRTPTRVRLAGK